MAQHSARFACRSCGETAGIVEVVPSPVNTGNRLVVSVFSSLWDESRQGQTMVDAIAAIDARDARALYLLDFEWAPFYCPDCDCAFCQAHWSLQIDFDEGFYDCIWGACPAGRRRKLED